MTQKALLLSAALSLAVAQVSGHCAITQVKGVGGPIGRAMGVDPSTPRDGTRRTPYQQDTSVIRDSEVTTYGPCGRTIESGSVAMDSYLSMLSELGGLPEVASGQPLSMTLHQVNFDGAGPYICDISMDGTGKSFTTLSVTTQVPGVLGLGLGGAVDKPLVVQMPQNLKCSGVNGVCIVRCRNVADAGPFGGCVPVVMQGRQPVITQSTSKTTSSSTTTNAKTTSSGPLSAIGNFNPIAGVSEAGTSGLKGITNGLSSLMTNVGSGNVLGAGESIVGGAFDAAGAVLGGAEQVTGLGGGTGILGSLSQLVGV